MIDREINILIADSQFLTREGLKGLMNRQDGISVVGEVHSSSDLLKAVGELDPDLIILDYCAPEFKTEDIPQVRSKSEKVKVLAMTEPQDKEVIQNALRAGIMGHLLKDCDEEEIVDAVRAIAEGKTFYCGKILDVVIDEDENSRFSCDPISLSPRELEIIQLVAEGNTNKEIAFQLHLSAHTVMTHRKNIMNKLGINHTAGIVLYAVKENIVSPNQFLFAPGEA